jgi:signal transduction histidine kinase
MTWLRARALTLLGILCLAGQGIFLYAAGTGVQAPTMPLPWLFLLLSVGTMMSLFGRLAAAAVEQTRSHRFWRALAVFAVVATFGTGLGFLRLAQPPAGRSDDYSAALETAVESVGTLDPALATWWDQSATGILAGLAGTGAPVGADTASVAFRGGNLFRLLAPLAAVWHRTGDQHNFGAVLWQGTDRQAWVGKVAPLPPPRAGLPATPDWRRTLERGRDGWRLRQLTQLSGNLVLEVQVGLTGQDSAVLAPGVDLVVGPIDDPGLNMDDSGLVLRQVGLGPQGQGPYAHLLARPESPRTRWTMDKARLLLASQLLWALALFTWARWRLGPWGGVAGLWIARGTLAGVETLRWVGVSFPDRKFPAPPGSWFSLADPAYFATPFAKGWFASIADALLSAAVVAVTVWYFLQWRGLVAGAAAPARSVPSRPLLGRGPAAGAAFGVLAGGALLALGFLAGLLAENANPRLIGTGIAPGPLAFWGLQLVLMLLSMAAMALVVGLVSGTRWQARRDLPAWLTGAGVAALVAALLVTWGGGIAWPGRLAAAGVAGGLWLAAPALSAEPRFLRRYAWPVVLLLTAGWNYTALRNVYDDAERSWLQSKGSEITAADPDWSRFLLGSVMDQMLEQDRVTTTPTGGDDLWGDEAAWRLYRDSALSDLGYQCAVELIDESGLEESYFALGFLNATRFEVTRRGPWRDLAGRIMAEPSGMIFRTERRRYPGGEDEVLTAEMYRTGGRGWLRVEIPVRSWRVATLSESLFGEGTSPVGSYRPRLEVDRPVLLLLADDSGWLDTGPTGIPTPASDRALGALRAGQREWTRIQADGDSWLCLWKGLPPDIARSPGEGFLLGLRRSPWWENVLDLSRLMLLDLILFSLLFLLVQARRWLLAGSQSLGLVWRPGFQERFLAGYLLLGLVLLVLVGMSVDQVGYNRVRAEARAQTRTGLARAVEQLRALLTEQASALLDSKYLDELMQARLAGERPLFVDEVRQGIVFAGDGELLLDETASGLTPAEAGALLSAGRDAPMVVLRDVGEVYLGVVIPVMLGGWIPAPDSLAADLGHSQTHTNGYFFYRQRVDKNLIVALAELVIGQVTLDVGGEPRLTSHPAALLAGEVPLLAEPDEMMPVLDHQQGASVFAAPGRPFAFTAGRPLPSLTRRADGAVLADIHPAVLKLAFPDRERDYANQRHQTILFLAGLANLILLTALLLALLMSWNIFRPLRLLLAATRSLAQGDFKAPLPEPGRDEVGRLADAFGTMRTDLQFARDALAAREQFLTTVLDKVPVGVAVVAEDGEVVALNPAGSQILADFRPGQDAHAGVVALLAELGTVGSPDGAAAGELVSRDRRRTLRGALAPLALPSKRTDTLLVFEDVTEFLATQKMALNAELARQVAHEIKNPLTPIQLSVQQLQQAWQDRHPDLDRMVSDTVERVLQQVALLRSIASEFSLLGRPGELEAEAVDLRAAVQDLTAAYPVAGGRDEGQQVVIAGEEVPLVQADRASLQKILGNLMQNSLDAVRENEPLQVQISWRTSPDSVTMIWRDNGTGLASEVADRLFDPYFSTKSKGTGLGLAICRSLAERMHGSISLGDHPEGHGAVAELTLPRAAAER